MKVFRIIKLIFRCLELIIQAIQEFILHHEGDTDPVDPVQLENMKKLQMIFYDKYFAQAKKKRKNT